MTTLLLEDLFDDAHAMTLRIAAADPLGYLRRLGERHGLFFSVCECRHCTKREGGSLLGVKDSCGARGGLSHSACPDYITEVRAELAARGTAYATKARN
jgi:hypothetical protein